MRDSMVESAPERAHVLNAVALQNAVLCAECDVVSDSPHDMCLVCGSRSLFNIARVFGGKLPADRVTLLTEQAIQVIEQEMVLAFPEHHTIRRRTAV